MVGPMTAPRIMVHAPAAVGTKEAKQEHQKTPPTTSRSLLPNTETSASQEVRIRRIPEHQTRLPTEAVTLWRPGAHFNFPRGSYPTPHVRAQQSVERSTAVTRDTSYISADKISAQTICHHILHERITWVST